MQRSTLRVLVADDQPLERWALARALSARGHDVTTADTREETCGRLFQSRFDVVIMCSRIGDQDMTDVLRELAGYQAGTRLIALYDVEERAPDQAEASPWVSLVKPFDLGTLLAAVPAAPTAAASAPS